MKPIISGLAALLLLPLHVLQAASPDLSRITSRSDLDGVIAAVADAALKKALDDSAAAILAAAKRHPHVTAVIDTLQAAPGTFTKINTTPEALRKAAGGGLGDSALVKLRRLETLPDLRSLSLHYFAITDASAVHLLKLKRLKRIILNGPKMTAAWHGNLRSLPLESLSVGQGNALPAAAAIAGATSIPTLRYFAMSGKTLTDADLAALAAATQLTSLSLEDIDLSGTRLPHLRAFAHLESLTLVRYGTGYPAETQSALKQLLPHVDVRFVR